MAITWTVTINKTQVGLGSEIVKDVTLLATGSYVTGGDATLAPANFGLDYVDYIITTIDGNAAATNGAALLSPGLGSASGTAAGGAITMKMYSGVAASGALTEVANATTMTGATWHCLVLGVD